MRFHVVLVSASLFLSASALACGFCGGDRAASVYSFKHKQFATRMKARYVSVEAQGPGAEPEFAKAMECLGRLRGIYGRTVRTAFAQRAASFVLRPSSTFEGVAEAFASACSGWSVKLVEDIE